MNVQTIFQIHQIRPATVLFLFFSLVPSWAGVSEKLTPEEVLNRHLRSIGSSEARASVKSRVLKGQGVLRVLQGGRGRLPGVVTHISEGNKNSLVFDVGNPGYRGEQFIFNGKKTWAANALPGQRRSELGDFVQAHKEFLAETLMGGVLSTGWAMLALDSAEASLSYRGLKKVKKRNLYRLEYRPQRGGSGLQIDLYFEPETFRHLRTTYSLAVPAQMGTTSSESAEQQIVHYLVEENFDDFRKVDGLTLPARWRIKFSRTGRSAVMWEWELVFNRCIHNQPIDKDSFKPR